MPQKITLLVVGTLAGILLGEALVGGLYPQVSRRPQVWRFDPHLGWAHIPLSAGRFVGPEFDVEIRINSEGRRDGDYDRDKPLGTQRVLAFGDSFIEGWGVSLEASVSKRLEARLQEVWPDRPVEVLNFGVAGYGTDQELLYFEKMGKHFGADQVLLFFYGNDLWNNALPTGIGSERGYKPVFRLGPGQQLQLGGVPVPKHPFWDEAARAARPWPARLREYLYRHWHLYVLAQKARADAAPSASHQDFYGALYRPDGDPRWDRIWDLSGRLLATFKERVEAAGARLVLVYVPAIVQIEADDWRTKRQLYRLVGEYDLQLPNRRLARLAADHGIPLVDLYEVFKQAAQSRTLYFRDSHWNEDGHQLAADAVAKFLVGH